MGGTSARPTRNVPPGSETRSGVPRCWFALALAFALVPAFVFPLVLAFALTFVRTRVNLQAARHQNDCIGVQEIDRHPSTGADRHDQPA